MILWDVNPESYVKKACAIVNRNFSHKEWKKYMGNHLSEKLKVKSEKLQKIHKLI